MQQYIQKLTLWQRIQLFFTSIKTGRPQKDIMRDIIKESLKRQKRAPLKFQTEGVDE